MATDRTQKLLAEVPLIDGHNDLAYQVRTVYKNSVNDLPLAEGLSALYPSSNTDIPRLRKGKLGAQFWSCYVPTSTQHKNAVKLTLEQFDIIHRLIEKYSTDLKYVTSSAGLLAAFHEGKVASLIGVEGGHSIDCSLGTLRMFYKLGCRYLTLTHTSNTPWATCSLEDDGPLPQSPPSGLNEWGRVLIKEMNRLGMMVDISHVSKATMLDVLEESQAPVIFSHSGVYGLHHHHRNVQDDVLHLLAKNKGILMVAFVAKFLNKEQKATVKDVADHMEYLRATIGVDFIGIGSDFDGTKSLPDDLRDVGDFPLVFNELARRGWTDEDMKKVAGGNLLRVFSDVEEISRRMLDIPPYEMPYPGEGTDTSVWT